MTTAEFQETFLSNAKLPAQDQPADVLGQYIATRTNAMKMARDLGVGEAGCREVCANSADAFVKRWMMLRFAYLDTSFMKKKWFVHVERTSGEAPRLVSATITRPDVVTDPVTSVVAEIRRFFYVSVDAPKFVYGDGLSAMPQTAEFGSRWNRANDEQSISMAAGRRKQDHYRGVDLSFSAALPDGVCDRHVDLARQAMAHYHVAVALCYRYGIDLRGDLRRSEYGGYPEEKVWVAWAPLPEAIVVTATPPRPVGDPAVLYKIGNQTFLLDFYDTPDEAPIEGLIREFSEGRLAS